MEEILELICTVYKGILSGVIAGHKGTSKKTKKIIKRMLKCVMWTLFAMLFVGACLLTTEWRLLGGVFLATSSVMLFLQLLLCVLFYKKR